MPEQVWIRTRYLITPAFQTRYPSKPFKLTVAAPGRDPVAVEIAADGKSAKGQALREFPDGLIKRIMADAEFNEKKYGKQLRDHARDVADAVTRVLDLIAQELDHRDGYRLLDHEFVWSPDGEEWHAFPPGEMMFIDWSRSLPSLNDDTLPRIQELIDLGEDALTATAHLREAYRAFDERSGWIEATIAAELAIKQILVRMEPKLGVVLFDMPSPPLHMLYGPVLKEVGGEASPFAKQLQKLQQRRNPLIHRPFTDPPDAQEFRDAVGMVHDAIRHALSLDRARARANAGGVQ